MAERRMFAKTIIDSDAFLDMPTSARLLYYDLGMRADDDGFVNSPKKIMRMTGASEDDLRVLITKKFIIPFDSGIVVIKHWRIHNYIRKDTYNQTPYIDELNMLTVDENKAYTLKQHSRQQSVDEPSTQVSIDKISIDKDNNIREISYEEILPKKAVFKKPTFEEVKEYCNERNNSVNPQSFIDFYESKGWKVGNQSMKDWKAAIRTWEQRAKINNQNIQTKKSSYQNYDQRNITNFDDLYSN